VGRDQDQDFQGLRCKLLSWSNLRGILKRCLLWLRVPTSFIDTFTPDSKSIVDKANNISRLINLVVVIVGLNGGILELASRRNQYAGPKHCIGCSKLKQGSTAEKYAEISEQLGISVPPRWS
jgi:hypothetical protein